MNIILVLHRPPNGNSTIIKAHEIQTINFTSLKKEVSLNKMVNNKTIVTQDTGHQTSRAEAKC